MKEKKILAIETSGELCSVAITLNFEKYDERNVLMKHIHSERLIPMIDELFKANNITGSDLDCVAVSIGPGSFTGLRIGMTAAKGIAFASNLPIVPVPSFDSLCLEIANYAADNSDFAVVNNANVDECYFGKYKIVNGTIRTIIDACLLEKNKLSLHIGRDDLIFGNLKTLNNIKFVSSPRAIYVAKWTYLFGEDLLTFDYDYLEPNYLKKFKVRKNK